MKEIVLDTNILIDNVHGFAPWVDTLLNKPQEYHLIVPTIVVAEYLTARELETETGKKKSQRYLFTFSIVDLTFEIAEALGQILRRKTYPKGADFADLIIAATAFHLEAQLATKNKADFIGIPYLRFFDPEKRKLSS